MPESYQQCEERARNLARRTLTAFVDECHWRSLRAGWWDRPVVDGVIVSQDVELFAAKIALIHSEVSEMLEGLRKGGTSEKIPDFSIEAEEAADIFIRLADYCGRRNINLEGAVAAKLVYNESRADHKPEARAAKGGKKI